MKGIYLIFILSIICQPHLFSQVVVKRNIQVSKEAANVNWSKEFTLFDYTTDEPIFPLIRNGQPVYKIYYASKEDLRPTYGEFSVTQVEGLKYYKFKNRETCLKFCLANKMIAVPTLTTTSISALTTSSAISGGNITADGGATITARGVVWSTTTNPTIAISTKTSNGNGTGTFTSTLTNLTPKTTYYVRAYATNTAGTGYGNEISFTTSDSTNVMGIPCPGTPTVKDIDGNTYNTVQIGTQCWTKENLRVTKYRDGSIIPLDDSGGTNGDGTGQTWSSRTSGARTVNGHNTANLATYGYMYNWYAVADTKGLCPSGWHVPSDGEWTSLTNYLGGESLAGGKMKSIGTTYWLSPNTGATNESGFSVLPGGSRNSDGSFSNIRDGAIFCATIYGFAYNRKLNFNSSYVFRDGISSRQDGFSIRCIKDTISIVSIPILTTTAISAIKSNSAASGGNITSDGGANITARGVVWSTSANPTIALTTKTTDGTGTDSFTSSLTNLTTKTTYYLRAYATNSAGTGYGNEITFTTLDSSIMMGIPCPGTPTVKDIDGNTYNTVQIGTQCWTKENLRVTKYRDGSIIPLDESGGTNGDGPGQTWGKGTGARTVYGHSASNLAIYGYLYNWYSVVDIKGLCPSGWHVPSDEEWTNLTNYLGGESVAGGKMKSIGTTYWNNPNTGANNESGFTTLPSGYRYIDGSFNNIRIDAFLWSVTEFNNIYSWGRNLYNNNSKVIRNNFNNVNENKSVGASVRCLKDTFSIVTIPILTTTAITAITTTSSTSGGNITADGGATITARGIVWATTTNPTIALSTKTSNGNGTGSFLSSLTNLASKTTYYVRAYATNSAGTGYGNEISFITSDSTNVMGIPCPGTPTVKDIDGNTYTTVQIGTQCWTKENLRVTKYRDGSVIPLDESGGTTGGGTGQTWRSRTTGARTVYGHSTGNLATYGYLYNWFTVADTKGLCPSGWHVPSDSEWTTLTNYLGGYGVAGGKMKTTGTTNWNSPNTGATNESGFSALPGGYRYDGGSFYNIRVFAWFWSATESDNFFAWNRDLDFINGGVNRSIPFDSNYNKDVGASVRCLKDTNVIVSAPSLTTTAITAIITTSATSGGNIMADGGASITARGVVWSTSTNPTIALSTKTIDGTGTGSFTSNLTNLTPKTTYYVRAYATNSARTGYGNEISFTTSDSSIVMGIPCPGTPTVKDIDGNTYNTVQIGTQCWTKENLRVTKYRDGSLIPLDESGGISGKEGVVSWTRSTGARTLYANNSANFDTYGYLYNWYAVSVSKGICPTGWHVPTDSDWNKLVKFTDSGADTTDTYLQSTTAGAKLKSIGTAYWDSPNYDATNESGFSAIPGGSRNSDGSFFQIKSYASFWSATEFDFSHAWFRILNGNDGTVVSGYGFLPSYPGKMVGASIRCLKDAFSIVTKPTLSTSTITAIKTTSSIAGGNITADGGAYITDRGVVWATSTNPTIALTTKTSDGTGTGSFSSTLTNLTSKTTYYVRAYATNSAGTGYGNEISFTTSDSTTVMNIPCPGTPTVKDIDGNTYNTVQIGTQCWTKENLRVTKYRDGSVIPLDESGGTNGDENGEKWSIQYEGARTVLGYSASNLATYGYLYNWYAIKNQKGICPDGWHPPNNREWNILNEFLGGEFISGNKLKDTIWRNLAPNNISTNESGFSALPGGWRTSTGLFPSTNNGPTREGIFWSLSDTIDVYEFAWYRKLVPTNIGNRFISEKQSKFAGFSVRCLKDSPTIVSIPSLTTTAITAIATTSATSGGNITSDGGATITARGVVWSTSTNPTIALTTKTSDETGTGSFAATLTNLTPKTTYYLRAYATNSAGTGYGNEISFITSDSTIVMGIPCPGTPTVKDVDGNTYNTVQIGTQCWTKENLRVTKYRDGTDVPLDESGGTTGDDNGQTWGNRNIGARTVYEHSYPLFATYGYLYNWYAATDTKGLCPNGWHVPSNTEWTNLTNYLGGESVAGGKMKTTGTTFWNSPNTGATNESGFSALPGGWRSGEGSFSSFSSIRGSTFFWSASEDSSSNAWVRYLNDNDGYLARTNRRNPSGVSVRCLRD